MHFPDVISLPFDSFGLRASGLLHWPWYHLTMTMLFESRGIMSAMLCSCLMDEEWLESVKGPGCAGVFHPTTYAVSR